MIKTLRQTANNLYQYRYLSRQLVRSNLVGGYKKSFIGLGWMLILPLITVFTWILLNGAGVVEPGKTSIAYPAFILLSTSIWGFFMEIYRTSSNVLTDRGRVVVMNAFPYEVLLMEKIIVHLINFSIPLVLNIVVLLIFGVRFHWWTFILFPVSLLPLFLLGLGIGMIVAILRVIAVDICTLVDEGMKVLMFLTPVVYAPKIEGGWLATLNEYNPLAYLISFSRELLINGDFYKTQEYVLCSVLSFLFFYLTLRFYLNFSKRVLERIY
jgi:lipopolysaccharide transport system permease protein